MGLGCDSKNMKMEGTMKRKVLRVLDGLTLVLGCLSFVVELLILFDHGLCFVIQRAGGNLAIIGIVSAAVAIVMMSLNLAIAGARGARFRGRGAMVLAFVLAPFCMIGGAYILPDQTMKPGFDKDLSINEYGSIVGEKLGTYAISILTDNTPVKLYWQCSSVTSYGPIRYGDEMGEFFITVDSGDVLAVNVDERADGAWITIKEFVLDREMLLVFIGEDDTEIMAEYLESMSHEIVNLSGKTDEEISRILEVATWNTLTWTTDELEKSEEDQPRLWWREVPMFCKNKSSNYYYWAR